MIGVAGCGRFGQPILDALMRAGAQIKGFDALSTAHPAFTSDIHDFAASLRTLFVVQRDAADIEALLFGTHNLLGHATQLEQVILCTDVHPNVVQSVKSRLPHHISIIDAAMIGSVQDVQNAASTFLIGGAKADVDDAIPLLAPIGQKFHHVGALGMGMQARMLLALIEASQTAVTRLVFDQGRTAGLSDEHLIQLLALVPQATDPDALAQTSAGYTPDNHIGLLVKNLAMTLDTPHGVDEVNLPQSVLNYLRNLKPRV